MARMSNRDRIARAAEEARLAEEEKLARKAEKKVAKKSTKRPSKASAKDVRMKIVWVVVNAQGKPVKTYAYPDKDAATSEVQRLSRSTGNSHALRSAKVPME
jgi:hypothetical protein